MPMSKNFIYYKAATLDKKRENLLEHFFQNYY